MYLCIRRRRKMAESKLQCLLGDHLCSCCCNFPIENRQYTCCIQDIEYTSIESRQFQDLQMDWRYSNLFLSKILDCLNCFASNVQFNFIWILTVVFTSLSLFFSVTEYSFTCFVISTGLAIIGFAIEFIVRFVSLELFIVVI